MGKEAEKSSRVQSEEGNGEIRRSRSPKRSKIAPNKDGEASIHLKTTTRCPCTLFSFLFSFHLILTFILLIFLTIRGFVTGVYYHPIHWFLPLLTAAAASLVSGVTWLIATLCYPSKALNAAFWLSPFLTLSAGVVFLSIGTTGSLGSAAFAFIFVLIQSLYACWVTPRRAHASRVISVSLSCTAGVSSGIPKQLFVALLLGFAYSCLWISGMGGAAAAGGRFAGLYVFVLLLSLAWTMQVIRNLLHVAISRVTYLYFAHGDATVARAALQSFGTVCLGSALAPAITAIRGFARVMNLVGGDADEFMFSCAHCYVAVSDRLVGCGNRWGFVHVGVHGKGFVQASRDTWEMFMPLGMVPLVDTDLTASYCFLCGVTGGALSAIVGGSWALATDKSLGTSISLCGFLIGYFMSRIATIWPQACVSGYLVAYTENPQNTRFDSTIPDRIRQLRPSQV